MDLDEQLAALAAGELDDDTARALRDRAATEPAIGRRLARHRRLQRLLEDWETAGMSAEAVARLDARLGEALAALDDGPLADERVTSMGPRALADPSDADEQGTTSPAGGDGGVVDLGEARRRRGLRGLRGLPAWAPGAAVAAALAGVVGTGIVVGGLPDGDDLDTMAVEDSAEEGGGDDAADAPAAAELFDDDTATLESDGGEAGPVRRAAIDLAEGELLALVEPDPATTQLHEGGTADSTAADDTAGEDQAQQESTQDTAAVGAPADAQCVAEALERDTEQADDREVWLVGTGTYADQPAVFVVIRTPATPEDRFEVLAYDPAGCDLLARDETTR